MNRGVDMVYDEAWDRWSVDLGGRFYSLHCGECFDLIIGAYQMPCRLGMDDDWLIIMKGVRMNLRTQDTYKVNI